MNQDVLVRFLFNQRDVRGEVAYASDSLQQMLQNHDYPYPVKQLLAELVVAVLTAVWFGDESMTAMEWAGGALITLAAFVEAMDASPTPQPQGT